MANFRDAATKQQLWLTSTHMYQGRNELIVGMGTEEKKFPNTPAGKAEAVVYFFVLQAKEERYSLLTISSGEAKLEMQLASSSGREGWWSFKVFFQGNLKDGLYYVKLDRAAGPSIQASVYLALPQKNNFLQEYASAVKQNVTKEVVEGFARRTGDKDWAVKVANNWPHAAVINLAAEAAWKSMLQLAKQATMEYATQPELLASGIEILFVRGTIQSLGAYLGKQTD